MPVTREEAIENIYASLQNNNENIDARIADLKTAVAPDKTVTFETRKLVQPTREGRRTMQAYFKKRGLIVEFE